MIQSALGMRGNSTVGARQQGNAYSLLEGLSVRFERQHDLDRVSVVLSSFYMSPVRRCVLGNTCPSIGGGGIGRYKRGNVPCEHEMQW